MARGGRRDHPIDRDAGPVAELADDLRRLRGPLSLDEVGRRMGYHSSTVSRRLRPDELPPLEFVRAYVAACGGDPDAWEERWRAIAPPPGTEAEPAREAPVRDRRRLYAAAAAVAAVAVLAGGGVWLAGSRAEPPLEAPSAPVAGRGFAWDIERMAVRLTSRRFALSASGDVEIWANLTCPAGTTAYWTALRPGGAPARYACGGWQRHTWTGVQPGTHHFEVWKNEDGNAISGRGVLRSTSGLVELSAPAR